MRSPSAKVRLALISEPDPPRRVASLLSTDLDAAVAFTARWQLEHLDETEDLEKDGNG
jgi:hypothetical protein